MTWPKLMVYKLQRWNLNLDVQLWRLLLTLSRNLSQGTEFFQVSVSPTVKWENQPFFYSPQRWTYKSFIHPSIHLSIPPSIHPLLQQLVNLLYTNYYSNCESLVNKTKFLLSLRVQSSMARKQGNESMKMISINYQSAIKPRDCAIYWLLFTIPRIHTLKP